MDPFLIECESRGIDTRPIRNHLSNPAFPAAAPQASFQTFDWSKLETLVLQAFVQILKQMIPV